MSDLSAPPLTSERIAELLEAAQRRLNEYVPSPQSARAFQEDVLQLFKSLPPEEYVEDRVKLAWNLLKKTVDVTDDQEAALGRAILHAAYPPESKVRDRQLQRWWLTAAAACESGLGNNSASLRLYTTALELARDLGDSTGEVAILGNVIGIAAGAGRFDEVLLLTAHLFQRCWEARVSIYGVTLRAGIHRANALFRLGRPEEALTEYGLALSLPVPAMAGRGDLSARHAGLVAMAEVLLLQGRVVQARLIAEELRRASVDEASWRRNTLRLEGLLSITEGDFIRGVQLIESCLTERPTSFDDSVSDALHALELVYRSHGDEAKADEYLRRIGQRMTRNAANFIDAVRDSPTLAEHFSGESRLREIDQYLASKRIRVPPSSGGESGRTWEYLISTAANASSAEDSTLEHGVRVACLAGHLARAAGDDAASVRASETGALIHEIGKIGVPRRVLTKHEPLSAAEQDMLDAHSQVGAELLERAEFEGKRVAVNVARFHHAPFDGMGGQRSPMGDAIPREARIVAICDAFDELVMGRPRKRAMPVQDALKDILSRRGRDFDPQLTDRFIETVRRLQREHPDLMVHLAEGAEQIEYFATQRMLRRVARPDAQS